MELFRIIKKDARSAMRSFGGRAVASLMICLLAYLAINLTQGVLLFVFSGAESIYEDFYSLADLSAEVLAISGGAAAVYLLVMPAVALGIVKLYLAFAEGKDESISVIFDMFSSFRRYCGAVLYAFLLGIRYLVTLSIAVLPGGAFLYFAYSFIPTSNRTLEILRISACCIAIMTILLSFALWLIFIQRWSLAPYYFAFGKGVNKSFVLSSKATKGLCTRIIRFRLSFIWWIIPSVFILPLLWSVPYYLLSDAIYSKYLMERYEHMLAQVPEISVPEEPVESPEKPKSTPDP